MLKDKRQRSEGKIFKKRRKGKYRKATTERRRQKGKRQKAKGTGGKRKQVTLISTGAYSKNFTLSPGLKGQGAIVPTLVVRPSPTATTRPWLAVSFSAAWEQIVRREIENTREKLKVPVHIGKDQYKHATQDEKKQKQVEAQVVDEFRENYRAYS